MSWVNPDFFLWVGFFFCAGVHMLSWIGIMDRHNGEEITKIWLLSGAFACFFGYLAFSSVQA